MLGWVQGQGAPLRLIEKRVWRGGWGSQHSRILCKAQLGRGNGSAAEGIPARLPIDTHGHRVARRYKMGSPAVRRRDCSVRPACRGYMRIAPGVFNELQRLNPRIRKTGRRQHKHHQWFTPDLGHPKLREHLAAVIALMRLASDWPEFKYSSDRAFPLPNRNLLLPLPYNTSASVAAVH